MNDNKISFSVIIPQRNSLHTLPRLFNSIPDRSDIEIILVDNSPIPISKEDVGIERDYKLLWSAPERYAGGARNVGIEKATGKWLIFSDADDFFTKDAFEAFLSLTDTDADVVYFGMDGVYIDTGEPSSAGDMYTNLVRRYLSGSVPEKAIRAGFPTPCSKMVRRELVEKYQIRYDEVVANNDDFFSLLVGTYASKIQAVDKVVYTYVATRGSIMHRRSKDVIKTRLEVILRCNKFKKEHGLGQYQNSVAFFFSEARKYGLKTMIEFAILLYKYKQNPFIGWKNWIATMKRIKNNKKNKKYIVNT